MVVIVVSSTDAPHNRHPPPEVGDDSTTFFRSGRPRPSMAGELQPRRHQRSPRVPREEFSAATLETGTPDGISPADGGLDLKKVVESSPTKLVVLVQERLSDQFAQLTMEVKADEPHQINGIELRAIPRPAEFALPHLSQSGLIAATRKTIEAEVAADRFAGAVLIAKDGKPVFSEAYGLADREHKTVPNTLKTRFRIGSMNKMFTAVAILQLVTGRQARPESTRSANTSDRLSQQRRRDQGHDPSAADAHGRHRRHLRPGVRHRTAPTCARCRIM